MHHLDRPETPRNLARFHDTGLRFLVRTLPQLDRVRLDSDVRVPVPATLPGGGGGCGGGGGGVHHPIAVGYVVCV